MKIHTFLILMICSASLIKAQNIPTTLQSENLKGNIKSITDYVFYDISKEIKDTTNYSRKTVRLFDVEGNERRELFYEKNKDLSTFINIQHLGDSAIVKNQFYKGQLLGKYIYKYTNGKLSEFITEISSTNAYFTADMVKSIYQYNDKGNLVKTITYNNGQLQSKDSCLYNDKNQKVKVFNTDYRFKKTKIDVYEYDSEGNVIKMMAFDENNKFISGYSLFCSNIDTFGNWMRKESENKGHSISQGDYVQKNVVIRYITYY